MSKSTLEERDGVLYVKTTDVHYTEPIESTCWWKVAWVNNNTFTATRPLPGDECVSESVAGKWHNFSVIDSKGRNVGSVTISSCVISDFYETRDIICPKHRIGTKVRYYYGRWQKLLSSGWEDF
jgi:hypothetical protein